MTNSRICSETKQVQFASAREEELKKQGWTRMFTVETLRVSEYVELYEETGMEVLVEMPTAIELDSQCADCSNVFQDFYRTIYTRPKKIG